VEYGIRKRGREKDCSEKGEGQRGIEREKGKGRALMTGFNEERESCWGYSVETLVLSLV
jgi:hypothetical protein